MTEPFDLAALLASHLCHELVGAVGAVVNGIEVLEESGDDPAIRDEALSLVGASAAEASTRLQFFRLAFGTMGGAEGDFPLGEAARLAAARFASGRVRLDWKAAAGLAPKDLVRVVLNLVLVAADSLPRGGRVTVALADGDGPAAEILAEGDGAALPDHHAAVLAGLAPAAGLPPRAAPALLADGAARAAGRRILVETPPRQVVFRIAARD